MALCTLFESRYKCKGKDQYLFKSCDERIIVCTVLAICCQGTTENISKLV